MTLDGMRKMFAELYEAEKSCVTKLEQFGTIL